MKVWLVYRNEEVLCVCASFQRAKDEMQRASNAEHQHFEGSVMPQEGYHSIWWGREVIFQLEQMEVKK